MRISDWSSDVCSSDLRLRHRPESRRLAKASWPQTLHFKIGFRNLRKNARPAAGGTAAERPPSHRGPHGFRLFLREWCLGRAFNRAPDPSHIRITRTRLETHLYPSSSRGTLALGDVNSWNI